LNRARDKRGTIPKDCEGQEGSTWTENPMTLGGWSLDWLEGGAGVHTKSLEKGEGGGLTLPKRRVYSNMCVVVAMSAATGGG